MKISNNIVATTSTPNVECELTPILSYFQLCLLVYKYMPKDKKESYCLRLRIHCIKSSSAIVCLVMTLASGNPSQ